MDYDKLYRQHKNLKDNRNWTKNRLKEALALLDYVFFEEERRPNDYKEQIEELRVRCLNVTRERIEE